MADSERRMVDGERQVGAADNGQLNRAIMGVLDGRHPFILASGTWFHSIQEARPGCTAAACTNRWMPLSTG
jgi:hypothetical protein